MGIITIAVYIGYAVGLVSGVILGALVYKTWGAGTRLDPEVDIDLRQYQPGQMAIVPHGAKIIFTGHISPAHGQLGGYRPRPSYQRPQAPPAPPPRRP